MVFGFGFFIRESNCIIYFVWEVTLSNWSGEESVTQQAVLNRSSLAQG